MIGYSVDAREKEQLCIGSKVIGYSVNARERNTFVSDQK